MWRQVYVRLRSFFRWRRQEVELDEEIRFHLTEEMEDQIAEGLSPAAARAAARRDFGNLPLIRELTRETWGWGVAERLLQDVRSAVRQLRARPAFTVAVVGILGLGIGANTAMFAIVNGVLLKPLPYPRSDRLVHIDAMIPSRPGRRLLIMRAENADIWRSASSIVDIAFYARPTAMTLTRPSADVEVHGSAVSVETLSLLGVPPRLGRVFDATDIRNSRDDVVVLSHLIWQRHFRADEAIVGQVIEVDRRLFTVVGVMPEHFYFPDDHSDFWFPASSTTAFSFARLRDTVTISAATAEFNTIAWSIEASRLGGVPAAPALSRRPTFRMSLDSMQERIVRRVRPALLALMGAVGLLLLLACSNVASLLTARATDRRVEIGTRLALGATRWRVFRQLVTESVGLAVLGAVAGVALSWAATSILLAWDPGTLPRISEVRMDASVFGFALLASLAAALIFGVAPAMRLSRIDPMQLMKGGASGTTSALVNRPSPSIHNLLTIVQICIATMLLTGATLMLRSFINLSQVDHGFDPTNVAAFGLRPLTTDQPVARSFQVYEEVAARIRQMPGVLDVAMSSRLPLVRGGIFGAVTLPGVDEPVQYGASVVSRDYFSTMDIRVVDGDNFDASASSGRVRVVLVNETMARSMGNNAIGQSLVFDGPFGSDSWEVIGIVDDVRYDGPALDMPAVVYVDYRHWPATSEMARLPAMSVVFRATETAGNLFPDIRALVRQIDGDVNTGRFMRIEDLLSTASAGPLFYLSVLTVFAGLAIALAAAGVYGLVSYAISQRSRELGVRVALGARPSRIMNSILSQTLFMSSFGIVCGSIGAVAGTRYLQSLLFGVSSLDRASFAGAAAMLGLVAALAAFVAARRILRLDPAMVLRE